MASQYIDIPGVASPRWKSPVASAVNLPSTGNTDGDVRVALDTNTIYVWDQGTNSWVLASGGGGGTGITDLIGDVQATGPGVATATIQPNVVSNSKLAQMPTLTIKGNNTGGTTNALDLTVAQVNTMLGTTGSATSIGALDSQAANAQGLALASNVLSTQSADATHPGMVNTTTQTFAGNKTFTGSISASNLSGTNTGDVTLAAVGSSPNANAASLSGQALTLQPADGTNPGVITAGAQTIGGAKTFTGAITASNLSGTNTGNVTIGTANGLSLVSQALSLALSSTSTTGALSSTDWNTFNGKAGNAFSTFAAPSGGNVVADNNADTWTMTTAEGTATIVNTPGTDTTNWHVPGALVHPTTGSTFEYANKPAGLTSGVRNTAIGNASGAGLQDAQDNTFIGYHAGQSVNGDLNTFVGSGSGAGGGSSFASANVGLGAGSAAALGAADLTNTALGFFSMNGANGSDNTAVGANSLQTGTNTSSTVVGKGAVNAASGVTSITVVGAGAGTTASSNSGIILLGAGAEPSSSSSTAEMSIGSSGSPITDTFLGSGALALSSPSATSLQPTPASGTNTAGAAFNLAGGKSTGTGQGGAINFRVSTAGSSGTSSNALHTVASVTQDSRLNIHDASNATFKVGIATANAGASYNMVLPSANAAGALTNDAAGTLSWAAYQGTNRVTFSDANYTIASSSRYIAQIGTLTASRTVTLPLASAVSAGTAIEVADESGTATLTNTIVIQRAGSDTINSTTSVTIASLNGSRFFVSDGVSHWFSERSYLRVANNLSDLQSAATARTNLGLGNVNNTSDATKYAANAASNIFNYYNFS